MPGISPRRSGASRGRVRRGGFGWPPRSSFGARLRSRVPQYGHSVMYGDTSEPQLLQTTKRSGPLAIGHRFYAPADGPHAGPGVILVRPTHTNRGEPETMALGYDGKLYILAFDHRGSFQKKMFGIQGDPTAEETETIADAKRLIFEGMELAVERGVDASATGVLVDEQFGSDIPERAKERGPRARDAGREVRPGGVRLPVRRASSASTSSSSTRHFSKVLVRYNPDGDAGDERAPARPPQGARRLAARARPQVPLRAARPGRGGAARAGRRRHRPLRRRAAARS